MNPTLLLAQAPAEPSLLVSLMPMILIFGVFYLIWFMPMRKKQKALDALLDQMLQERVAGIGGTKTSRGEHEVTGVEVGSPGRPLRGGVVGHAGTGQQRQGQRPGQKQRPDENPLVDIPLVASPLVDLVKQTFSARFHCTLLS